MKHNTRHILEQLQIFIYQWKNSGLSTARFCEEQGLGYGSFCDWRKRFINERPVSSQSQRSEEAAFIDLVRWSCR
ncbi:IS66 family insertion sequence element accessory protein TnpA [Nitrincola tibetensis]|uniref:IS66 family insertion sequence element accessory protein TnpA n=1 Tax=Nitrincola tibetensis TaxID=2219697 RepID=UPI00195FF141|nr:hypothetical protein [Nitrincola tibetensis]